MAAIEKKTLLQKLRYLLKKDSVVLHQFGTSWEKEVVHMTFEERS